MQTVSTFCLIILLGFSSLQAEENELVALKGNTMGTTYSIRYRSTRKKHLSEFIQPGIDQLLNSINQSMSTYIPESELSRFNQSESVNWQEASEELVFVISAAQKISRETEGAFDITVGPLVNLWNFGPEKRDTLPTEKEIEESLASIGYQFLEVRLNPPALKKLKPKLYVDLSAIAKGYAVDRVTEYLDDEGIENYLVEIGGEIRTRGGKTENGYWTVAIEKPDPESKNQIKELLEFRNEAIATSGNYRNFRIINGKTYSHTINPETGKPVDHQTVSVSVIGPSCMECDAWATALSVLPPTKSMELAKSHILKVLLLEKNNTGLQIAMTNSYSEHPKVDTKQAKPIESNNQQGLAILVLAVGVFSLAILGMAVGVIFSNRCIKGSCGGLSQFQAEDGKSACELCSTPAEECENKKAIMEQQNS